VSRRLFKQCHYFSSDRIRISDAGRGRGGGDTRRTDEQLLTETKEV